MVLPYLSSKLKFGQMLFYNLKQRIYVQNQRLTYIFVQLNSNYRYDKIESSNSN